MTDADLEAVEAVEALDREDLERAWAEDFHPRWFADPESFGGGDEP